jgi:hypothetical protein
MGFGHFLSDIGIAAVMLSLPPDYGDLIAKEPHLGKLDIVDSSAVLAALQTGALLSSDSVTIALWVTYFLLLLPHGRPLPGRHRERE